MEADQVDAIKDLLGRAEEAHALFEATELDGVYDHQWPHWYAVYAVDHGIGPMLGHDVTADQLAAFLASSYAEFERLDPRPSEPWAEYAASRLATEL
ncbi:MAG: hypothetical protein H0W98_06305 [Chloroflexi bacterium]|nr:hypothetical protein [Chloroflexota bacterium]